MNTTIWTIGYGGRKPADFVELLRQTSVELVADVRLSPRGAMGSYTRAKSNDRGIQKLLGAGGIAYEWLPELGNPDRTDPLMTQFRTIVVPEFPVRARRLLEWATSKRICLLCGCKLAIACHRSIITDWLRAQDWRIVDL